MRRACCLQLLLLAAACCLLPVAAHAQTVGNGGGGASGNATSIQAKPVSSAAPATNDVLTWNGSVWAPAALGTGSAIWSGIGNPTANLSLNLASYTTLLTWGSTSGTTPLFELTDGASDTGTGVLLRVTTAAGSAEIPIQFDANGNGVELTAAGVLTPVGSGAINATELEGSAVSNTAPSSGQVLTWSGSSWAPAAATGGMANPMTAAGDLIVGGTSGAPARLAVGTNGDCLTSNGTTEAWASCGSGGGSSLAWNGTGITGSATPATITLSTGLSGAFSGSTLTLTATASAPAFGAITTGTNNTATMSVASGASIVPDGGTIDANQLQGSAVSSAAPTTGQFLGWNGTAWAPTTEGGCFNVKLYGAAGNDSTDDTAAIESAISAANSAGGGCVFFPPTGSKYLVDGELVIPDNTANNPPTQNAIELVGVGAGKDGSNAGGPPVGGSQLDLRASVDAAPAAPDVLPTTGTGSLAAATYYVEITYVDNTAGTQGETTPSAESTATLSATGELTVASPSSPGDPYAYNVYIGTSSGAETLQNGSPIALGTAYVQSAALASGAALPAANTTTTPKILTLGRGTLAIYGLALTDYGADCAPFIATTNTVIEVRSVSFWGDKPTTTACNDGIVLGATNASLTPTANAYSLFQGYGTVIRDNFFGQIRRAIWAGTAANSVMIESNTVWEDSGDSQANEGAFSFHCAAGGGECDRDYITGNLIEVSNYPSALYFDYVTNAYIAGNQFWDAGSGTAQFIYADANDGYFTILDTNPVSSKPLLNSGAPTTFEVISSGSGGANSYFTNPVTFRGTAQFNAAVTFQGTPSFTGNWELRFLPETASYSLSTIDQVVAFNCTAGCTATLPAAASGRGMTHCVIQTGTSDVTVAVQSGDTINGGSTFALTAQYARMCAVSDGSHGWWVYSQ